MTGSGPWPAVAAHLRPGGLLVIDLLNPTRDWLSRPAGSVRQDVFGHLPSGASVARTETMVSTDLATLVRVIRSAYETASDGVVTKHFVEWRAIGPTPRWARTPGRSPRVSRSPARSIGRRPRPSVRTPPPFHGPGAADWTRPGPAPAVSPPTRPPGFGHAPSTAGRTVPAAARPRSAPFPRDGRRRASVAAPTHQQEHRRVGGERLAVVTALHRFDHKACPFQQVFGLEPVGVSEGPFDKVFGHDSVAGGLIRRADHPYQGCQIGAHHRLRARHAGARWQVTEHILADRTGGPR